MYICDNEGKYVSPFDEFKFVALTTRRYREM